MDNDELYRTCLKIDFASSAELIATRPNLVFAWEEVTFRCLFRTLRENCGIWGEDLPQYGPSGPDEWEGEWPLVESFWRWGEPANQDWLMRQTGFGSYTTFQMLIPAGASVEVLRNIKETSSEHGPAKTGDWECDLRSLVEWVEDLRWACVPLVWGEMGDAVFVGGSACGGLAARVIQALRETGHGRAEIVRTATGAVVWQPILP